MSFSRLLTKRNLLIGTGAAAGGLWYYERQKEKERDRQFVGRDEIFVKGLTPPSDSSRGITTVPTMGIPPDEVEKPFTQPPAGMMKETTKEKAAEASRSLRDEISKDMRQAKSVVKDAVNRGDYLADTEKHVGLKEKVVDLAKQLTPSHDISRGGITTVPTMGLPPDEMELPPVEEETGPVDYVKEKAGQAKRAVDTSDVKEKATDLARKAEGKLAATGAAIKETAEEAAEKAKRKSGELSEKARDTADYAKYKARDTKENIDDSIRRGELYAKDKSADLKRDVREATEYVKEKAHDVKETLDDTLEKGKGYLKETAASATWAATELGKEAKDKAGVLKEKLRESEDYIAKQGETAKDYAKDTANTLSTKGREYVDTAEEYGERAKNDFNRTVESGQDYIRSKVYGLTDDMKQRLEAAARDAREKGRELKEDVKEKGQEAADYTKYKVRSAKDQFDETLKSDQEYAREKGYEMKEGMKEKGRELAKDIRDTADYAKYKARDTKESMEDTYKQAQRETSSTLGTLERSMDKLVHTTEEKWHEGKEYVKEKLGLAEDRATEGRNLMKEKVSDAGRYARERLDNVEDKAKWRSQELKGKMDYARGEMNEATEDWGRYARDKTREWAYVTQNLPHYTPSENIPSHPMQYKYHMEHIGPNGEAIRVYGVPFESFNDSSNARISVGQRQPAESLGSIAERTHSSRDARQMDLAQGNRAVSSDMSEEAFRRGKKNLDRALDEQVFQAGSIFNRSKPDEARTSINMDRASKRQENPNTRV